MVILSAIVTGGEWASGVEAYNGSTINLVNTDANANTSVILKVTANSKTSNDEEYGVRAHGILAVGQTKPIKGENGEIEEEAYGGSTVNINTDQLTITANSAYGGAHGIYAEDDSVIKVNGNANVEANGFYAYGVEAINGSNVELGGEGKKVFIYTYCQGDNSSSESIAVYAKGEKSKVDIVANELTIKAERSGNQLRRSLVAINGAVINLNANKFEFVGRILAEQKSEININADIEFNGEYPLQAKGTDSKINLIGGEMTGVLKIANSDGNVNLAGATYTTSNLKDSIIGEGKLTLTDKGVLKTIASEVFSNTNTTVAGSIENDVINSKVVYKAGSVSLAEDYSYNYLTSALNAMENHKYDGSNTSSTKLIMTGKLVDESITANQASDLKNKAELNTVTVKSDENLLVGADVSQEINIEGIGVETCVDYGFSANQLELGNGSTGAIITGGQEIVLGGSQNNTSEKAHEIITVGGETKKVTIVVGTKNQVGNAGENKGTLSIGNSGAQETYKYQLTGKAVINEGSELYTKGETTITNGVELKGGKVNVEEGHHLKADIKAEGENNVIRGKVTSDKLEADNQNTIIHLGDEEYAGNMHVKESNLNGGMLFLDPETANNISEASIFTLETATELDGGYVAGQNSVIALGVSDRDVTEKVFAETNLSFGNEGDVDAVIYVAGNTNLKTNLGSITANGELTSESNYTTTAGKVTFADKSLLMVEANKITNTSAISGVTATDISNGAKLYINNAVKDKTYKILAGTGINDVWMKENIFTNNQLVTFETIVANDGSAFEVTTGLQSASNVYGDEVIISDIVDKALFTETNATEFFNAAVNENNNTTKAAQIDALNSIGSINELAGVTHTTYAVNNILTDAVADHMSLANGKDHDKDIWAHYVHTKEQVDGLKRAGSYDSQYNGIVVGADLYKEDKGTVGAVLTYVDGNINGSTLASRTENDAKYYGASIYGSIKNEDTAVIADVSYLHGEHDITQRNSGKLITGEPESDAFSVGVRVENATKAGIGKLIPYAGLRYMHLGSGNYSNSIGLTYDADDAELFLLPVGLKYSSEVRNTNGWTMRPVVELGYVWAFGDTDTNQTVSLNGTSNGFGYDVTDSGSYVGRFLLEAEKSNISYALGYEYQKGDSVEADKWMLNVNWKF